MASRREHIQIAQGQVLGGSGWRYGGLVMVEGGFLLITQGLDSIVRKWDFSLNDSKFK